MTGVEILATEEVAIAFAFGWLSFWISMAICMTPFIIIGLSICLADNNPTPLVVFVIVGIIIGGGFGTIAASEQRIPSEYETQYKVTISDEVSMNDFLDKYEIIDQEGKIYTVRERK